MIDLKICFKCNVEKDINKFYKHKQMKDGHLNKCIECAKKDAIEARNKNINYYLEYDKNRSNNPDRVEARKKYSQTEEGMKAHRKAKASWAEKNLIKRSASVLVNNAIKYNKIIKPEYCEECNKHDMKLHGHHDDYAYPLEVRWLCSKCHRKWHKDNGSALNG